MLSKLLSQCRRLIDRRQRRSRRRIAQFAVEHLEVRQLLAATLTFEGLQNLEPISEYYNGGLGGFGSGPGTNFGVRFSGNALAITDRDAGGTGNIGGEPSPSNAAFFLTGGGALTMNVAGGFERGFSFYYSAINNPGSIRVYDGLNGTGNVITTLALPRTPFNGAPDPTGQFSPFVPLTVEFSGTAKSVDFGGTANQIAFDNITLGPLIEIQDYLQKKTDAVKVATLISETGVLNSSGSPTSKFNKLDNDRFFVVIDDKSIGTPQVVINQIEIVSIGRNGTTVVDSLPKLRLNRQKDGRFISQPLILVADDQDDAFGGNEGTENDLTIKAEAGGFLKIKYKDTAGTTSEKKIDVGRPAEVKKVVINATYLIGSGFSDASVKQTIETASKLFSQANAYLEIKKITGISDPGNLLDLDEFVGPENFVDANGDGRFTFTDLNANREHNVGEASESFTDSNGNGEYDGFEATAEERQLLALNRDTASKVVNVYFVRSLSNNSLGEAFTPGVNGDVGSGFQTTKDSPFINSIIVRVSNAKTFGHELVHIMTNSGGHTTDIRRLLVQGLYPETDLHKKRILRTEGNSINTSVLTQAGKDVSVANDRERVVAGASFRPATQLLAPKSDVDHFTQLLSGNATFRLGLSNAKTPFGLGIALVPYNSRVNSSLFVMSHAVINDTAYTKQGSERLHTMASGAYADGAGAKRADASSVWYKQNTPQSKSIESWLPDSEVTRLDADAIDAAFAVDWTLQPLIDVPSAARHLSEQSSRQRVIT